MSTHIPEFEVALQANDFQELDSIWLKLLEERPTDAAIFLHLAKRLADRKDTKRAATMLAMCIEPLKKNGKFNDAFQVLKTAADYHPKEAKLWDELMELVPIVFSDVPEIGQIITDGRLAHDKQPKPFLDYLQIYTTFRIGDFVEHTSGWGVGKVVDVLPSEGRLVVDFNGKPGHKFALEAARRMLNLLGPDHILVWKTFRLDELRQRCTNDIIGILKMCLATERNHQLTQRDLKARLVPDVMDQKTWSKFLTAVKKAAQKDEFVRIGVGQNPTFTLLDEAQEFSHAALERFAKPGSWEEKLERARAILTQMQEHDHQAEAVLPAVVLYFAKLVESDADSNRASGLAALLLLDEVSSIDRKALTDYESSLPTLESYFDPDDPHRFVQLLEDVPIGKYQRDALARVIDFAPEHFADTIKAAFLSNAQPLWEESLRQCEQTEHGGLFDWFGEEVSRDAADYADNFMWYAKQVFHRQKGEPDVLERYKLFEKVLVLAGRLQHKFSRGDKNAKNSLQKLKTVLSEDSNFMLTEIVKDLTADQAAHLYNHIGSCTALGNTLPPKLRRKIRHTHPSVEAPVEAEEGSYFIDPGVSLTTDRGLIERQRLAKQLKDDLDENAKAIGAALEMGDISENAELDAAREKEARLKARLAEVSASLKTVKMLTADMVETDRVTPGCRVTIRDEQSDDLETKIILGIWDADITRGILSYKAPMAEALLGARVGDVVQIPIQGNRPVRIERIENALSDEDEIWGEKAAVAEKSDDAD